MAKKEELIKKLSEDLYNFGNKLDEYYNILYEVLDTEIEKELDEIASRCINLSAKLEERDGR
jgi:hypothetical protein